MGTSTLQNLYLKNFKVPPKKSVPSFKKELKIDDPPMLHREALLQWLLYP